MAGIGFELRKLFNEKGVLSYIRAYFYSAFVIVGPMLLFIFTITVMQGVLDFTGIQETEKELFLSIIQYSFIFSIILTSGFSMIVTRYVSDKLYEGDYDKVGIALIGSLVITIFSTGIIGLLFYSFSTMDTSLKFLAYTLFVQLSVLWIETVFLSALSDYKRILRGFISGICVALAGTFFALFYEGASSIKFMLISFNIGILIIIMSFFSSIIARFKVTKGNMFDVLICLEKYPQLYFINLFYNLGLYIHVFFQWSGEMNKVIEDTYLSAPFYDTPVFYAFLSIIPSVIIFVIRFEPKFYKKYKIFYSSINSGGNINAINSAKSKMIGLLKQELEFISEIQAVCSLFFLVVGISILNNFEFPKVSINSYIFLIIGCYFISVMYINIIVILYFDDRFGALLTSSIFLTINIVSAFLFMAEGAGVAGLSLLISAVGGYIFSVFRLRFYLKNIDYIAIGKQKIFDNDEGGIVSKILSIIDRMKNYS